LFEYIPLFNHLFNNYIVSLGVESGIKMYKGEEVLSFEGTFDKESGASLQIHSII